MEEKKPGGSLMDMACGVLKSTQGIYKMAFEEGYRRGLAEGMKLNQEGKTKEGEVGK